MDITEIQNTLANMETEIAELRAHLDALTMPPVSGSQEAVNASAAEPGGTSETEDDDDGNDFLGSLLSAIGSSGGLELLSSLMGEGKRGGFMSLLSAFASQDGGGEKLFDALGALGPEAKKTARKLRSLWPFIQMLQQSGLLAGLTRKATGAKAGYDRDMQPAFARTMPPPVPAHLGPPLNAPIIRSMQSLEEVPQEWGSWSILRYNR